MCQDIPGFISQWLEFEMPPRDRVTQLSAVSVLGSILEASYQETMREEPITLLGCENLFRVTEMEAWC